MIQITSLIIITSLISAWAGYYFTKEHYLSELLHSYENQEEDRELNNSDFINTLLHLSTIANDKEFNRISCIKIKNKVKYLGGNSFNEKTSSDIKNTINNANEYIQNNSDNCDYLQ